MTFAELRKELDALFPKEFEKPESAERKELQSMDLLPELIEFYGSRSPRRTLAIGRFRLLPLKELIDENIWDSPGEFLYPLGLPIVGLTADDEVVVMNAKEPNKLGKHELYTAPRDGEYETMTLKTARLAMKFLAPSFEELLTKELVFVRKGRGKSSAHL